MSMIIDNLLHYIFSIEVHSCTLDANNFNISHSTGVVLGGNGIRCTGTLHVSSGVVFAARYGRKETTLPSPMFEINGDLTVGANTVLLGPLKIEGPCIIGAMSLVTKDIISPGTYVGIPAKKIK